MVEAASCCGMPLLSREWEESQLIKKHPGSKPVRCCKSMKVNYPKYTKSEINVSIKNTQMHSKQLLYTVYIYEMSKSDNIFVQKGIS